jgi:choice-of-anchor B domain-containing protein
MSRRRSSLAVGIVASALLGIGAAAHAQTSSNMTLLGHLDSYPAYSDIWGYTDPLGREYAIMGTRQGTTIVNVTDPATAYETGFIAGAGSAWRDMKTYGHYAYVVTEGGGGMDIVDLSDPENPVELTPYTGFSSAHNIYIEEATARAYPCGTNNAQGFWILDLSDPEHPVPVGSYAASYVHDLYVRDNVGFLAEINAPSFSIFDLTNPTAPLRLAGPVTYPGAFTHNTWLTDDGKYMLTTDERVGGHVRIWDIQNFLSISQVAEYQAPVTGSIVHNVTVRGDRAYVSYYSEGVRVVDIAQPDAPSEVGFYDTWAGSSGGYNGAWGVYPYLPSGHVLVSDIETGLYVFSVDDNLGKVLGTITESSTGLPLANVDVELVEPQVATTSSSSGSYALSAPPGTFTLLAHREGFFDSEQSVTLQACCETTVDIELVRMPSADVTGTIRGEDPSKTTSLLAAAEITLVGTGYAATSVADGSFLLPEIPLGTYAMRVVRAGYGASEVPITVIEGGTSEDVLLEASPWYDNADSDLGWSLLDPDDTAITGQWIRAVPVPSGGGDVQPGVDATPDASGGLCFVTGNASGPGAALGEADVDGGKTTLTSPAWDLSGLDDPQVAYSRWYVNQAGANPGTDVFTVQISDDDGGSWVTLETLSADATPWTRRVFRVLDYVTPSAQVRVRFVADDSDPGSLVEAVIDDIEYWGASATAVDPPADAPVTGTIRLEAYPNPFNPTTQLRFELRRAARVRLDIHDLRGRRILQLIDRELEAGVHVERWDGHDAGGHPVASGVYVATLQVGGDSSSQKLVLAK